MEKRLYRYRAVDAYGEPLEGSMEEESSERVTTILAERGIQVSEVEMVTPDTKTSPGRALDWAELALFNDQLRTITRSGLPIAASLKAMALDLQKGRLRTVLTKVESELNGGASLEEAIQRQSNAFPSMYVSMIRAGEQSGNLPGILDMMGQHSARVLDVRNQLKIVLAYPVIVVVMSLFVIYFMLVKVVPVFAEIFTDFGSSLPAPTQLLLNMSNAIIPNQVAIGVALVALVVCCFMGRQYLRSTAHGEMLRDRAMLRTPFFGRMFRTTTLARFSRSLGLMLGSQVPVLESLDLAAVASGNAVLKQKVDAAAIQIAKGEKMADAFSDTGYFPHAFCWFVANGENFGNLPDTLLDVSHSYEENMTDQDRMLINFIGPVITLGLGLFIGFTVVALYLPIFSLGDALTG